MLPSKLIGRRVLALLICGALYLLASSLDLSAPLHKAVHIVGLVLLTYIGATTALFLIRVAFIDYWLPKHLHGAMLESQVRGLMPAMAILIWTVGIIFLLDNLGFKISTMLAGLGIGGVAVALASQSILGDLFSYFSIMLDKPFVIGDFIVIGNFMGNIEYVGIKSTRLRSLSGEQLILSNKSLTDATISNFKRMKERRVTFRFGVSHDTPADKAGQIPETVSAIISKIPQARFDRATLLTLGSNLVFEVVYYILTEDYRRYMEIQQQINLDLKRAFEKETISFTAPA